MRASQPQHSVTSAQFIPVDRDLRVEERGGLKRQDLQMGDQKDEILHLISSFILQKQLPNATVYKVRTHIRKLTIKCCGDKCIDIQGLSLICKIASV